MSFAFSHSKTQSLNSIDLILPGAPGLEIRDQCFLHVCSVAFLLVTGEDCLAEFFTPTKDVRRDSVIFLPDEFKHKVLKLTWTELLYFWDVHLIVSFGELPFLAL